ncbi:MAG: TetR/AcrR family transcriptional regulator [Chloroflexota bacterium]
MTQTQSSYKAREKRRREHEIVLEARRLFRESGAVSFNMDSLAEAVGVSKPTLYQHFRSKEDLIVRVLVDAIGEMGDYLDSTHENSPLERLKKAMRLVLEQRYSVDGLRTDLENGMVYSSLHSRPEVVEAKNRTLAIVNQVIDDGKASGEIVSYIPTALLGCLFFRLAGLPSTVQVLLSAETGDVPNIETVSPIFDHVIDLFARSIALETPTI